MKMLVTLTALIVAPLLVLGNVYEDYPQICNNEILTLQNINSKTLLRNFIVSPSLRCLSILISSFNSMESGVFDEVPNLMYLNLNGNSISPRNLFSFGEIPNLRALILSNQNVGYYDTDLQLYTVYPKLQYLNLKNTKFNRILSDRSNPFPSLTHLDLSSNSLSDINLEQFLSSTLQHLNLDDNQLTYIRLEGLSNLTSLTMVNNKISFIGYGKGLSLSGLESLEYLSLWNNEIESIDETAFRDTVNLKYLNMSGNLLKILSPETLAPLTSLEVLLLDDNRFEELPLRTPLNVTTLSINCNNIKYLTTNSLLMLPNLKNLSLSSNIISSIYVDSSESQIPLEELYLNDNNLTHLPERWQSFMKNLRYLNLAGNGITSIRSVFSGAEMALEELHLEDNPLGTIDANSFAVIPENATIFLNFGAERSKPYCSRSNSKHLDYY